MKSENIMLLRRIVVENVRSFRDRTELLLDGPISIIIGPNGGGKTNLLDTTVIMLRRYLFASMYAVAAPTTDQPNRHEFRVNDVVSNMALEKYTGVTKDQWIEIEIEVTDRDIEGMRLMRDDAVRLTGMAKDKYQNIGLERAGDWQLENITPGCRIYYRVFNGGFKGGYQIEGKDEKTAIKVAQDFLQFLQLFEMDGMLRDEFGLAPLATPLIYLPVNRAASGFSSSVQLSGYNHAETKRHLDGAYSRQAPQIVSLAVGRLAQKYRLLLEKDKGLAAKEFREDENFKELTKILSELGYEWSLETVNPLTNQYDIRLKKQGSSFLAGAASSGERELLTYLFAIFALNVRHALIIVDEPELHLHPKWQKTLLQLFTRLAQTTGNQFLLATHSPTFVSPDSIKYISRVFSRNQNSRILRLDTDALPEAKYLLNIVNSQNNERLFFADKVILVEGISDRIFFEAILDRFGRSQSSSVVLEVVSVGGKGLFDTYVKILRACQIDHCIIADRDYVEQVGSPEIKSLFKVDSREIKVDVVDNVKSLDGDALVAAIDTAVATGSWDHAKDVWSYIKSRRRRLRGDLDANGMATLQVFLASKHAEGVYILSQGALETYLPPGHASKDLERLIRLLSDSGFWELLPEAGRAELEAIAKSILQAPVIEPAVIEQHSLQDATVKS